MGHALGFRFRAGNDFRRFGFRVALLALIGGEKGLRVLAQLDEMERTLEGLMLSGPEMAELRKTYDFSEGVNAFVEKRKPEWKNR